MTPPPYRLIITGSRNWNNEGFVWLQMLKVRHSIQGQKLIVVQGDCPSGPDRFARQWVLEQARWGDAIDSESWEADWSNGLSGGFRRNENMVRAGADEILGFVADCIKPGCNRPRPHGSHGTTHCLKVAKHYGIRAKAWKTKGWLR